MPALINVRVYTIKLYIIKCRYCIFLKKPAKLLRIFSQSDIMRLRHQQNILMISIHSGKVYFIRVTKKLIRENVSCNQGVAAWR